MASEREQRAENALELLRERILAGDHAGAGVVLDVLDDEGLWQLFENDHGRPFFTLADFLDAAQHDIPRDKRITIDDSDEPPAGARAMTLASAARGGELGRIKAELREVRDWCARQ